MILCPVYFVRPPVSCAFSFFLHYCTYSQGRYHNFETAREASRKILWVVPPIYDILGVSTTAKRHTESLSDNVTQEYACYNIS